MSAKRGVTTHLPGNLTDAAGKRALEKVSKLPPCWIRDDLGFWILSWEPNRLTNTAEVMGKMMAAHNGGHSLILNIVPCPVPDFPGWNKRVGGPWKYWFRPDFRLWDPIQETLQMQIDFLSAEWTKLGRQKADLRFEWFNEPGSGNVSGMNLPEPRGNWSLEFHAFCNHLLVRNGGINFRGHKLMGPTLSFLGDPTGEKQELETCTGGSIGRWWSKIDQRAFNSGVYLTPKVKTPEDAAKRWITEVDRRIQLLLKLDIPVQNRTASLHEWYVSHPMLGQTNPPFDEPFRAECMLAIGEEILKHPALESAYFYCLLNAAKDDSPYNRHHCENGFMLDALRRYLSR